MGTGAFHLQPSHSRPAREGEGKSLPTCRPGSSRGGMTRWGCKPPGERGAGRGPSEQQQLGGTKLLEVGESIPSAPSTFCQQKDVAAPRSHSMESDQPSRMSLEAAHPRPGYGLRIFPPIYGKHWNIYTPLPARVLQHFGPAEMKDTL